MDGAHHSSLPVDEGLPATKPIVDVKEGMAISVAVMEEVTNKQLREDNIEGGHSV